MDRQEVNRDMLSICLAIVLVLCGSLIGDCAGRKRAEGLEIRIEMLEEEAR